VRRTYDTLVQQGVDFPPRDLSAAAAAAYPDLVREWARGARARPGGTLTPPAARDPSRCSRRPAPRGRARAPPRRTPSWTRTARSRPACKSCWPRSRPLPSRAPRQPSPPPPPPLPPPVCFLPGFACLSPCPCVAHSCTRTLARAHISNFTQKPVLFCDAVDYVVMPLAPGQVVQATPAQVAKIQGDLVVVAESARLLNSVLSSAGPQVRILFLLHALCHFLSAPRHKP
jgi:hypothetical protein